MSDISSIIAELEALQQYETYEPIARRLEVAACALYVWDFVLTFHHEVDILWLKGTRWSTTMILFFINRYLSLGAIIVSIYLDVQTNPVVSTCHAFTNFDLIGFVVVVNIETILLRRLFILYEYQRTVVVPMVALYIAAMGATLGLSIALSVYSQTREYVTLGICVLPIPIWFRPFWVPLMSYDFIIVILAGYKSVQRYRHIPNKNWFSARFMKVLARDSFVYFALNFLNYLLITLILQVAPPEFFTIGASWTIMIPPITANHLLINMEYSRFANNGIGSTMNVNTFTSVKFADGVEATSSSE